METPKRREARGWLAMKGGLAIKQPPFIFLVRQLPDATRVGTRGSRRHTACRSACQRQRRRGHRRRPAPQTPTARVPSGPVVGGDDLVRGYGLRRHEPELECREACWSRAGDAQFEDALKGAARRPLRHLSGPCGALGRGGAPSALNRGQAYWTLSSSDANLNQPSGRGGRAALSRATWWKASRPPRWTRCAPSARLGPPRSLRRF